MEVAKGVFSEHDQYDVIADDFFKDSLQDDIFELAIDTKDPDSHREELLVRQDKDERIEAKEREVGEKDNSSNELIRELYTCFKAIRVLGQIVRNFPGSLKSDRKAEIVEEAVSLGKRAISQYFRLLSDASESAAEYAMEVIKRNKRDEIDRDLLIKLMKRYIFNLSELVTFSMIRRVSSSLSTPDLEETFIEVFSSSENSTDILIDISIHLEQLRFPKSKVLENKKNLESHVFAYTLLRHLIANHFYFYKTDISLRQEICEKLDIKIQDEVRKELFFEPLRKI